MARLKLHSWDSCINDCIKSIEIERGSMKGYYYLAQAQLALNHPNEALSSALTAYQICLDTHSPSTSAVSALVLQAKKQKWEAGERERIRSRSDLLREIENGLLRKERSELQNLTLRAISTEADAEERGEIESSTRKKISDLRSIFAIADPKNMQRRVLYKTVRKDYEDSSADNELQEVPDYLIDNISFAIMHDPVVTKTGNSYDRSTLMEHLKRSSTDPLTREPLRMTDLRPNLALKQACEEFLAENGWAVDW